MIGWYIPWEVFHFNEISEVLEALHCKIIHIGKERLSE